MIIPSRTPSFPLMVPSYSTLWQRFIAFTLAGLLLPLGASAAPAATPSPIPARIQTLQNQPVTRYADFPGTVVPSDYVQVAARMSGYVSGLAVDVGQSVKQDQLLLRVNPTEVKADLDQARSQRDKARAALATATENYHRFKDLYAQKAVPKQRFQEVELAYKAARSDLEAAEAGLDKARNQVGYAELRAPFDGIVFAKNISNGQLVNPGEPLLTLYDPHQLQVQVEVDEAAYGHLHQGAKLPLEYDGTDRRPVRIEASVENLVAAADPVTHTHTVKLRLPADSGAQGGEYARVQVPMQQTPGLLIPRSAIHQRAGITGVFVQDAAGNARFRMVTLGERRGDARLVLSGLFPGDRLIVSAQGELANGVAVRGDGQ